MTDFARLLAPGAIGTLPLRNRILLCPMGDELCNDDGSVSANQAAYYEARARGGAALLLVGSVSVAYPYASFSARQTAASDDRYLRYIVARLAAYRNVWWSMANEWDLCKSKTLADWDRYFRIVQEEDPYGHLRSIHNCFAVYDHAKPWVTHQSIQANAMLNLTFDQIETWRERNRKPVVIDECCYEGNIPHRWGNISGREMVHRFWQGTVHGAYVGHGDTFLDPQDILWWAKGGVLKGESAPRLAFLRSILEEGPGAGLEPTALGSVIGYWFPCAGQPHEYYLGYFGEHQPAKMRFDGPEGEQYRAEIVDTWEMTRTPVAEPVTRGSWIDLPQKPYLAVILRRA